MSGRNIARKSGLALFAAVLVVVAAVSEAPGQRKTPVAMAANLDIILEVDSVTVGVNEPGTWLSVALTNIVTPVGGTEVLLQLNRADLLKFSSDSVETMIIVCIDSIDCDPADTIIDTVAASDVDTVGTLISGWEFVQGRALSDIVLQIAAIANQSGTSVPPIPTGGTPETLLRVYLEKVVSDSVLDTLQNRTTRIFIIEGPTSFSTTEGERIGRAESLVYFTDSCSTDTALCDSINTVSYDDPAAFLFIDGVRVFSPTCVTGDVNESGAINASDIIYMVQFVFKGGPAPTCSPTQGDVNCNGSTNASDIIFLVQHVFKGGAPPAC